MRAGNLDRIILIERASTVIDEYGTPRETWETVAKMRAQLLQSSTEEFIRAYGASSDSVFVFRIRWLDGVTLADRVSYEGQVFDLKDIKELGRREGLELRCVKVGA